MKFLYVISALVVTLASEVQAHMSLWYPPPLGDAKEANPFTTEVDKEMNSPFGCCDSTGAPTLPSLGDCRGHLDLLDTKEGSPQVTWRPGEAAFFQLSGYTYTPGVLSSTHYGGSCQAGFSVDKGQTWKVAASYHGNCPYREKDTSPEQQTFDFHIPLNIPVGSAVFAWIWLNREHESFTNCASVQISQWSNVPSVPGNASSFSFPHSTISVTRNDSHVKSPFIETSVKDRRLYSFESHYNHESSVQGERQAQRITRAGTVCSWDSAPRMETQYFTRDARCATNAKLKNPESDRFEIGWADACGIVEGDGEYPIQNIQC